MLPTGKEPQVFRHGVLHSLKWQTNYIRAGLLRNKSMSVNADNLTPLNVYLTQGR
jgi:hypothetical protein